MSDNAIEDLTNIATPAFDLFFVKNTKDGMEIERKTFVVKSKEKQGYTLVIDAAIRDSKINDGLALNYLVELGYRPTPKAAWEAKLKKLSNHLQELRESKQKIEQQIRGTLDACDEINANLFESSES